MTNPVLIIGAGVAGLTAAVELADSGVKTILIDRQPSAGGNALDLYKAFPTDDCFYCFEGNRWRPGIRKCFYRSAMVDQPNIDLRTDTVVVSVSRKRDEFEVRLRSGPIYVDPKKCTMCGLCIQKSRAFVLPYPQCQPQSVVYRPELNDGAAREAEKECPTRAIDLSAKPREDTVTVSDIVIATGYHEMQPKNMDEYGYGRIPDVVTQLELARLLDPNGPTGGALRRPSDGSPVQKMVMVQCVGSRDERYYPYCSKICCVFALKHAHIALAERGCSRVTVVYMDIRTYERHERYYLQARLDGADFVRGRVHSVSPAEGGGVLVVVYDSLLNKFMKIHTDLLVLSSALEPSEGTSELVNMLGLRSASGFVSRKDATQLDEFVVGDRIYACGTALGPAEVPESVTQARAVVSRILQSRGGSSQ
ncbi:MAG: FAD-dependent oxidoreductase [Candidatus Thorarchaeota archaeon]